MNKLKTLSIAICCLVSALWSEAQGMDVFDVPTEIKEMSKKELNEMANPGGLSREKGDPMAQFWLGEQCSDSDTKLKKKEAQKWWRSAALKGHKGAIERLISSPKPDFVVLVDKEGTEKFHNKYRNLYDAARKYDSNSCLKIGDLYAKDHHDIGMSKDMNKAIKYWGYAAQYGSLEGIQRIYEKNMEKIG